MAAGGHQLAAPRESPHGGALPGAASGGRVARHPLGCAALFSHRVSAICGACAVLGGQRQVRQTPFRALSATGALECGVAVRAQHVSAGAGGAHGGGGAGAVVGQRDAAGRRHRPPHSETGGADRCAGAHPQVPRHRAPHVPQPGGRQVVPAGGAVDQVRPHRSHRGTVGHARRLQGGVRRGNPPARHRVHESVSAGVSATVGRLGRRGRKRSRVGGRILEALPSTYLGLGVVRMKVRGGMSCLGALRVSLDGRQIGGQILADAPLHQLHRDETARHHLHTIAEVRARHLRLLLYRLQVPLALEACKVAALHHIEQHAAAPRVLRVVRQLGHVQRHRGAKPEAQHALEALLLQARAALRMVAASRQRQIGNELREVLVVGEHLPHQRQRRPHRDAVVDVAAVSRRRLDEHLVGLAQRTQLALNGVIEANAGRDGEQGALHGGATRWRARPPPQSRQTSPGDVVEGGRSNQSARR
eukprot:ctg_2515.g505